MSLVAHAHHAQRAAAGGGGSSGGASPRGDGDGALHATPAPPSSLLSPRAAS